MIENRGSDLFRYLAHAGVVGDLDVEAKTVVAPGVSHLPDPGVGGQFEVPGHDIADVGEAGVGGEVGIDAGHFHGGVAIHFNQLADGIDISEEGSGQGGRQQDGIRIFKGVAGAAQHMEVQKVGGLGLEKSTGGGYGFTGSREYMKLIPGRSDHIFEVAAIVLPQDVSLRNRQSRKGVDTAIHCRFAKGLGDPVVMGVALVEGDFVPDPQADEDGDGHAGGEASDIDSGGSLVRAQAAPRSFEIVFQHTFPVLIRKGHAVS